MNPVNLNGRPEADPARVTERVETGRTTEAQSTPSPNSVGSPSPTDSITVSEHAAQVRHLAAKVQELPEVRQDRIKQLRAQMQANRYHVSAEKIAEAILKDGLGSEA